MRATSIFITVFFIASAPIVALRAIAAISLAAPASAINVATTVNPRVWFMRAIGFFIAVFTPSAATSGAGMTSPATFATVAFRTIITIAKTTTGIQASGSAFVKSIFATARCPIPGKRIVERIIA